ncbi:MAG: formimidoylglutamase [Thermoanaerobaculia bacterium]
MTFDQSLLPVDPSLLYTRNDPNDRRLGDVVLRDPDAYVDADAVVIGCPQDEGVARNRGRVGAREAPTEIRRALYRYPVTEFHEHLKLLDLGDVRIADTLEATHDLLHAVVRQLVHDGKKVVILGGGNDISFPDCSALAAETRAVLAFNIDKHLDVRADVPRNSGTPYRQLLEGGHVQPDLFHEVGTNSFANSLTYRRWVEGLGAHVHYLGDLREAGVGKTVDAIVRDSRADAIFFGFDLDVVRAVEAPGVSDPTPMGLTAREICEIADVASRDPRTRIIEITEVNPRFDRDGITSKLAANIVMRALASTTHTGSCPGADRT